MRDRSPFPHRELFQIGPRRQGSAAPFRALDGSGPIREAAVYEGKGGTAAGEFHKGGSTKPPVCRRIYLVGAR